MHETSGSRTMDREQGFTQAAVLVLAAVAFLLAIPAAAHSPADMTVTYDPDTAKISVTITHIVDDPAKHYLSRVKVKLNGNVISDPDYKSQPTKDTFTLTYDVNAQSGDEILVTASCVQGGGLEKAYRVPEPVRPVTSAQVPSTYQAPPKETVPPTAKSPAGLLSLLGAVATVLALKRV